MNRSGHEIAAAYAHCRAVTQGHYENFPVASRLLPARMRDPVAAIYAFARRADDLADEGDGPPEERLAALDTMARSLEATSRGTPPADDPVFVALADTMAAHALPAALFHDLLDAFRQDVTKKCYADFTELLDYCRRSANPVGRLMLHLAGEVRAENLTQSDAVCTALQLINLWQDIAQDYEEMGRVYLPADEMAAAGVSERHIAERINDESFRRLMRTQYARAAGLLAQGRTLGAGLSGRFGAEIRAIVAGGERTLARLTASPDPFARPRLRPADWAAILRAALSPHR